MTRTFHGILSLLILAAAAAVATLAILQTSVIWAVLYLVGLFLSALVMIYSFCTKCPCRKNSCRHVIPGMLTRFFPARPEEPYTFWDKTGVVVPIVFFIVFPQYWLLQHPVYLSTFVALCLVAAADIQFFVCRGCGNRFCPFFQVEQGRE